MTLDTVYILMACVLGLAMTWGVGANDLANIMSTTMGSKSITVKQAMIIAIIFEFAGAFFGGSHVTSTVRSGIIDIADVHNPDILIYGMLSILMASSIWMLLASYLGMPVSITNAIVGSIVGFGAIVLGVHAIHWNMVGKIAISWVSSPTLAGIVGYIFFSIISRNILSKRNPLEAAKRCVPIYLFIIGVVLSIIIVHKGLLHFKVQLPFIWMTLIMLATSLLVVVTGLFAISKISFIPFNRHSQYTYIEKMFGVLMAFTACAMVFAHGSNDVSIAVGPISAVISAVYFIRDKGVHSTLLQALSTPGLWEVTLLGCVGVVAGLLMYGRRVIETVGSGITALTPSRAVAATLAAASTVLVSTTLGIPVSTTQTLVGAVLGVGLARGIGALNLKVIRNIFMSWILTIPAAAALSILIYWGFKAAFGQ